MPASVQSLPLVGHQILRVGEVAARRTPAQTRVSQRAGYSIARAPRRGAPRGARWADPRPVENDVLVEAEACCGASSDERVVRYGRGCPRDVAEFPSAASADGVEVSGAGEGAGATKRNPAYLAAALGLT